MSVFDQFSDGLLPGDKKTRRINPDNSEYITEFEYSQNQELETKPQKPFWIFYTITLVVMGILLAQLLNLQISQGAFNKYLAEGNRIRQRIIPAPRGIIFDRNGTSLITNDASFSLEVYPLDLPKKEADKNTFYQKLSEITKISADDIKNQIKEKGFSRADTVVLKENIDRDTALLLETKIINLPGVIIGKNPIRNYKEVFGLSQIIGYIGKATDQELKNHPELQMDQFVGKDGLEKSYQAYLNGKNGANEIEVDSKGRAQRVVANISPQPGNSLKLYLDSDLEQKMADVLQEELTASNSQAGSVVAIDPKTGGVLGMVSLPTYNNNVFSKGLTQDEYSKLMNDEMRPMFNRSIAGTYPSGSTIKPFVASAGLQDGTITENTTINDTGEIKVGNYVYPDWKAHGLVDVRKAIAVSANVFFYAVGGGWDKIKGLGVQKLHDYLVKFGFGKELGIDLPSEDSGLVPDAKWKEEVKKEIWYLGDTYHMSIGQGDVNVTPLQMAVATAAIANNGELLKPYLVQKITDGDGKVIKDNQKEVIRSGFIDQGNLQIVREGMRNCVDASYGSCRSLSDLPAVAAKTGTAQYGAEGKTHAWMISFAPYNDPQIALAVIVEGGGEGYSTAGPVTKNILNWYFTR
ncbi:MAG: penicillin-binding protein 2 [Candidatus Berkelbacteria bacterium]|nr:penicillin-binding protein 2 [Candidatus Berkelbacteria bacterium]